MSIKYIRDFYRVPAKRGARVIVGGKAGVITGAQDAYILVRFDGDKAARPCHPTSGVTYLQAPPDRLWVQQ